MAWEQMLAAFAGIAPVLPQLSLILLTVLVLTCPIPGRGPRLLQRQDPWRLFKGEARRTVMARAGGRCEGSIFLAWGRCGDDASDADHVYPWSRSGPTIPSNGQALCRGHNRNKAAMRPPWWYVLTLERRRRKYFPSDIEVRVNARISTADLVQHTTTPKRQVTR
jgi:hypothetical protein